jgi:hypothetical protein
VRRIALGLSILAACMLALIASLPASGTPQRLAVAAKGARLEKKQARKHRKTPKLTRYSLVHRCYFVLPRAGGRLGPFFMQPAALSRYLLYGRGGDFLGPNLAMVSSPGPSTIWIVRGRARHFTLRNAASGRALAVSFKRTSGCSGYPEAQVGASGRAFRGRTPAGAVTGTVEGHAHVTAFEFFGGDWHCGAPWSRYGAPSALPASCAPDQQGTNGEVEAFIDFGGANRPSDMHGWPTFREWPSPTALAEEGDYYTGIERAWKAGLRLMVTNLVDNEALCSLMSKRHNPCNDMAAVHIQSRDLYALQDYIDAQSGGPGKGWFRIVTDPFQARRVINQGKLAVIEGIEVSRLFGCGERYNVPQCGTTQVDAGLREVHKLGVRTFFPVHEFDNAFGGTKGIAGEQGELVNAGNRLETGSYWTMQPCRAQDQDAEQLTTPPTGALAQLLNGPGASLLQGNPAPVYGPGPQCNTRGLTGLGAYLIRQMIKRHVLIQLDHMSSKTATAALAIAEGRRYSGVISAHCCSSPQLFERVYKAGGFITPPVQPAAAFISTRDRDRAQRARRYQFGFGWGSDENGLGDQPGPSTATPISYPFKSFDGKVTFGREQWGQRVFDLNNDGLANYGMYADWLQELQRLGGRAMVSDMFRGAEAYLETWERAYGVRGSSCVRRGVRVRRGMSFKQVLYALGQPSKRLHSRYKYCVRGGARLTVGFNKRGRVADVVRSGRR